MSLVEILLDQKMILISVLFALAPLFAAITLSLWMQARRSMARRNVRRARQTRIKAARQQALAVQRQAAAKAAVAVSSSGTPIPAAAQAAPAAVPGTVPAAPSSTSPAPDAAAAPAAPTAGQPAPAANGPAATAGGPAPAPAGPGAAPTAEQPPTEAQPGRAVSSAMQDILSSVFTDDDLMAHYEALLKNLDDVAATDLLTLAQQISEQVQPDTVAK